jgi:hypothetical protein
LLLLPPRHEGTLANRVALGHASSTLLRRISPTRPAFRHRRAAIRPHTPVARRAHSLPPPARLAKAAGRCLTCRSTGRATAWHPGRAALSAYPPPRGQGVTPPRAGYLYVRPHVRARTGASSLEALAQQPQSLAHFGSAGDRLGPSRPMLCVAVSPTIPRRHHRALRAGIRQLRLGPSAGQLWLALRASVLRRAISSWARRLRYVWSARLPPCGRRNEPPSRQIRSGGSFVQLSLGQAAVHRPSVQLPASQGAA